MSLDSDELEITPITPEDYPEAFEVFKNSAHFLVDISGEPRNNLNPGRVTQEAANALQHRAVFAGIRLKKTRRIAGLAVYEPSNHEGRSQLAWIALLMISEPYQLRGYGRSACRLIEQAIFADPDIQSIRMGVLANNTGALKFWHKMGYLKLKEIRHETSGAGVIVMEKRRVC